MVVTLINVCNSSAITLNRCYILRGYDVANNIEEILKMKLLSIRCLAGLFIFGSLLVFNHDTAYSTYSKCKSINKEAPTPYCFKLGDSGRLINVLVKDLREAGYYKGKNTTKFNSEVQQAVIKFQKDYRSIKGDEFKQVLKVDGIVGADTLIRLCQAVGRGCGPNDDIRCYTGSPVLVQDCLNKYK